MHFGLEGITGLVLYLAAIAGFLAAAFRNPVYGLYVLIPLLPLQTIRYRLNQFPLGASFVGVMLLGVAIGLLRQRRSVLPRTGWNALLIIYGAYTLVTLVLGSFYLGTDLPFPGNPRFGNWLEYMFMPGLLFLTAAVELSLKQIKIMVLLIMLATFAVDKSYWDVVSSRDYSEFSNDLRESGTAGYAGNNGLAAYEAQVATFLIALAAFQKSVRNRAAIYTLAGFSIICLMYSLSRGGYVALAAGLIFIGALKQRWILVGMCLFAFTWKAIVPAAVEQRIFMTYDQQGGGLDHSAQTRLNLWEDAWRLFDTSPVVGTGFNTYQFMHRIGTYEDTHNYYLKVLVETGVIGLAIFVALLLLTVWRGLELWLHARNQELASLGFGLAAWMISCMVANAFGDRWSFLQVNGYMWVLAGLVARARDLDSLLPVPVQRRRKRVRAAVVTIA